MRGRSSTARRCWQTLREAFDAGVTLVQEEIRTETGRRIQASLDFIHDDENRQGLGALVTLHDLESAEEIESELELSRRMAAIGRLTSGVGHEVKNPINAIVVHLELLKTKLGGASAPAVRHLEVIDAEIHRLDRVVQMLVDFSRPVELQLREQDLRSVIGDVLTLAAAELSTRNVKLVSHMPAKPLMANIDADLLKQAVLNVIQNGAQAMPEGGTAGGCSRRGTANSGWKTACALPIRAPGFPKRSGRRSSISISPPRGRQRHRPGHDLPHSPVAPRQHRSTIESRAWHGVSAANSTRRRGMGAPKSSISVLPEEMLKPPIRHRKTAGDTQQEAGETAGVSAIGQLSSGDLPDESRETADSIAATESGLNGIHRTLSTGQRKTVAQIRRFLKQAREALDSGDVDGAQTLVAKAKVLLKEIAY
jgi:hypothetical protein